jgi:putative transcriptional regulator
MMGLRHLGLALIAPAVLFAAAPPNPDVSRDTFLTGQLLIAAETMGDPRFQNTVLVMVRHNGEGAMGLIVNRPLGEQPLAKLLDAIGEKSDGVTGSVPIYAGGPVERERAFVLHSGDYHVAGTLDITPEVAATGSPEIFHAIGAKTGPGKFIILFGYAGWGAGQLESELAQNAWYTAPVDSKLVFDADRDKLWEHALQRRTRDL